VATAIFIFPVIYFFKSRMRLKQGNGLQYLRRKRPPPANWNDDSDTGATKPECAVNIAFTAPGLAAAALPEESLNTFPQEFREGIAEQSRSRRLGDNGASTPTNWDIGGVTSNGLPKERVHGLLILQASSKEVLSQHRAEHEKQLERYRIAVIRLEEGHRLPRPYRTFWFSGQHISTGDRR